MDALPEESEGNVRMVDKELVVIRTTTLAELLKAKRIRNTIFDSLRRHQGYTWEQFLKERDMKLLYF